MGTSLHRAADRDPSKAAAAEDYLSRAEKEFGDVELGRGRDGKPLLVSTMVKGPLFQIRNLSIGKVVPEVTSKDLDDKAVKLSELRGKVVILDFWATWCPPCKAMIPHSREMVEKLKDKPFVLISISSDAQKKTLTDFLGKEKMPWTHWWEGNGQGNLHSNWGISGIPTIFLIDSKGVIRKKVVGFNKSELDKMEAMAEKLIKEIETK